ncbi:hypothetical protein IQ255_02100 [Pleurocapsales cyanobacterium LEGE 10410]|nr:hypothetical protein [Pleurocapsales cyanobacterium LEGE 10410]
MTQPNPVNFLAEAIKTVEEFTEGVTAQVQTLLEQTAMSTGQTMEAIASNPILKSADNIIGLDWLMTFLGKVNTAEVLARVERVRSQNPNQTPAQIAHQLIMQKAWEGGRLGLLTNIIPPVAALFLGIELIATTKLQTEMVYEIAAAYGLDLEEPTRRGEVLAIFGLSLGADAIKTGLTIVEILPGIGAVVGASTNAAMLYVLGQTACRFYEGKANHLELGAMQQKTDLDWQVALRQTKIMDRIITHMVKVSYPEQDWAEILPKIREISPSSVDTIAENLQQPQDLSLLLKQLLPDFAPTTLNRCYDIAKSTGEITLSEQEILSQIATKFDLDMSALGSNS